jgi:hypothetical protein
MSDKHQNPPLYLDDLAVGERFTSAAHRLDRDQADGDAVQILIVKLVVPRRAAN